MVKKEANFSNKKRKKIKEENYLNKLLDNLYKLFSTTEIDIRLDSVSHYPRMLQIKKNQL
jgi:hypothetical protein